jgi:CRP/FNR family transcriptional regulator
MAVIQECSRCLSHSACVMGQVNAEMQPMVRSAMQRQTRLAPGDVLTHPGLPFERLYLVRYGSFKTVVLDSDGRTHTTGLHGRGEVLGLEGLDKGQHQCEVTALQHASVCVFRYEPWCELVARIPSLQQAWLKALSRSVRRDGQHMLLLGCLDGQERVASFLLMLWQRMEGAQLMTFDLMMTRQEIGNYLGMTLESVSRHLSQFQRRGWIRLHRRQVTVLQLAALQRLHASNLADSQAQGVPNVSPMGWSEQSATGF